MKRKRKNKLIALVLAVSVFVCGLVMPGSAADVSTEPMMPVDLPDQRAALAANELLWKTFTLGEDGMPIAYPEEYGGSFIDGELLYIYLVGLNNELEAKYMEICKGSSAVRFLKAEYSANYLQSLYDVVKEVANDYAITAYGIDSRNNRFRVEIDSNPNSKRMGAYNVDVANNNISLYDIQKDDLLATLDNDAIVIEPGEYVRITSNIYGGDSVDAGDANGAVIKNSENEDVYFSVAIGGTYNGVIPAILTAGHCIRDPFGSDDENVFRVLDSQTNEIIGIPIWAATEYCDGSHGDYSIIRINNSNYNVTNDVYQQNTLIDITSYATSYPVGQSIFLSGARTKKDTGIYTTCGTIFDINRTITYELEDANNDWHYVTVSGICIVSHSNLNSTVKQGDSGGAVFGASVSGNGYSIIGNISGHSTLRHQSYFSPIGLARGAGFEPKLN